MALSFGRPVAIVDVETTGGSPLGDRVIEIGIVRVEPDGSVKSFSSLVNPERYLPRWISTLTGIQAYELEKAPLFSEIHAQVSRMLEGALFIAHNARFDYSFIKAEFRRLEIPYQAPTLCSARFSKALYPEHRNHDLSTIAGRFGLEILRRHRALDDAKAVLDLMQKALEEKGEAAFQEAFERLSRSRRAQCLVPEDVLDALPEATGVYLFYGEAGDLLYIGKAKNLKERVLSHFYSDHENGQKLRLASRVARIETRLTSGELSACLLESELIKSLAPSRNRRMVKRAQVAVVTRRMDEKGFMTVKIDLVPELTYSSGLLGVYTGLRQAKNRLFEKVEEGGLCAKSMGLESGKGVCFSYHLKKCKGACAGEEPAVSYNLRFLKAFGEPMIKAWPFDGPAMLTEEDPMTGSADAFVIQDWRVLSWTRTRDGLSETLPQDRPFDMDSYRIILDALKKPGRLRITDLPRDGARLSISAIDE